MNSPGPILIRLLLLSPSPSLPFSLSLLPLLWVVTDSILMVLCCRVRDKVRDRVSVSVRVECNYIHRGVHMVRDRVQVGVLSN